VLNEEKKRCELLFERLIEIKAETNATIEELSRAMEVGLHTVWRWLNYKKINFASPLPASVTILKMFIDRYAEAKKAGKVIEFFKSDFRR